MEEDGAPGRVEEDTSGTCWASAPPTASALPPPMPPAPPAPAPPPPRGLWMQHCPENSRQIFSTASRTTWSLNWRDSWRLSNRSDRCSSGKTNSQSGCSSYLLHVGGEPGWGSLVFFFGPFHFLHDNLINRSIHSAIRKQGSNPQPHIQSHSVGNQIMDTTWRCPGSAVSKEPT